MSKILGIAGDLTVLGVGERGAVLKTQEAGAIGASLAQLVGRG